MMCEEITMTDSCLHDEVRIFLGVTNFRSDLRVCILCCIVTRSNGACNGASNGVGLCDVRGYYNNR